MNSTIYKKYYFILTVICFLSIIIIFISYKNNYYNNSSKINIQNNYKKKCENINSDDLTEYEINICKNIYPYKDGFMYAHGIIVGNYLNSISIIIMIILLSFSIILPSEIFKNDFYQLVLMRTSYKNFLSKIILLSLLFILPIIGMIVLLFILEILFFGLDNHFSIINDIAIWSNYLLERPILFIILYITNMLLYLVSYVNISFIYIKRFKSYFKSLVASITTLLAIQLFLEIVIKKSATISIINYFRYKEEINCYTPLMISSTFWIITFLLLIYNYYKKEKIVF